MILVLTMAGRYQRFVDEGYKLPKYLLPWGDKTILSTIIKELLTYHYHDQFSDVLLIANYRDEQYMPHVDAIMQLYGLPATNLILTHDTSGQAATALIGAYEIKRRGLLTQSVVFHNIDTILYNREFTLLNNALKTHDGFIDVFTSHNPSYSYVMTQNDGKVREIAEKIVISDLATSGLYGFKNASTFIDNCEKSDIFISEIYKRMIDNGLSVIAGPKYCEDETLVLGTPAEYMNAALINFNRNR